MRRKNGYKQNRHGQNSDIWKLVILAVICVIAIAIAVILFTGGKNKEADEETRETMQNGEVIDEGDPQTEAEETGTAVDITTLLASDKVQEIEGVTYGIDVAKYQGEIDWQQVADAGIDFAMIRVGYRTTKTGEICEDSLAKYNMQEATKAGIKIGVYFFSTAINETEAIEEADWVADFIESYQITYPVAFNCENFQDSESRQFSLTKTERTDIAIAFLNEIYQRGYTPMFYAAKNELTADAKWETSKIETTYKIWVSQYPIYPYPQTEVSDYAGVHAMWQYTNQGTVPGIKSNVDVDIAYFGYEGVAASASGETPEEVTPDVEALMNFAEVNETVTAKEKTNLRDKPSQGEDSSVMTTLTNGQTATRTGTSSSGWSRLEYNGEVYYALSSLLTTDLSSQPVTEPATTEPVAENSDSGSEIKTQFATVSDTVSPKNEVNLRTMPSVTNPESQVVVKLAYGENVERTGVNTDVGWSRVIYNGQTLYCISSYIYVVEE